MPEAVRQAVLERTQSFPFNRYPPIKSENLCEAIAQELDLDIANVKIGNGSSELLQVACYVFGGYGKKIAVPYPSFSMYGEYATLSDSVAAPYPLTEEGYVDPDVVIEFCERERPALLIVCNPNNPTGNYNSLADMEKIIANVECPVIMDEAYMEFADGKEVPPTDMRPLNKLWLVAGSTLSLVGKYSNLMVFRTFSKAYGLAGLRCGYAVGAAGVMRLLGKALLPYHVNAYTLMVAKTLYENKDLYKEQIKLVRSERDKMAAYLAKLGFKVWPTATNFVTFCAQDELTKSLALAYERKYRDRSLTPQVASGKMMLKYLMENSILVRDYSGHAKLTGCLRVTVGTPEENLTILQKLTALCTEVQL
jgi:histidinol-phosphate aminotransferase